MPMPLYHAAREHWRARRNRLGSANRGLVFDKFFDECGADGLPRKRGKGEAGRDGEKEGKAAWIARFAGTRAGDAGLLTEMHERRQALVAARGGVLRYAVSEERFVTGLGRHHPVENGFAWHHGLGAPYLAGSGLKGAVLAYVRDWEGAPPAVPRIFGAPGAAGAVLFLDLLPVSPAPLAGEIMTPHYEPYYSAAAPKKGGGGGSAVPAPGDWFAPIPIPFLAVDTGAIFAFALLPRRKDAAGAADAATAAGWTEAALEWDGAGAKTAVGYGRFAGFEGTPAGWDAACTHAQALRAVAPKPEPPPPPPRASETEPKRAPSTQDVEHRRVRLLHSREIVTIIRQKGSRYLIRKPDGDVEFVEKSVFEEL